MIQIHNRLNRALVFTTLGATLGGGLLNSCGGNNPSSSNVTPPQGRQSQSLYNKYGGAATIRKIVNDAATALIADCVENPYFTTIINFDNVQADGNGHGSNGHDTADRLKSCLVAQFTTALGGPSTYIGSSTVSVPSISIPNQTYNCESMTAAHQGLGIPPAVFDQFVSDLGVVLAKDGVAQQDISAIAMELMGLQSQIVAPQASQITYDYAPGQPSSPPGVACTVPSPTPSSAAPSPSPSLAPSTSAVTPMSHGDRSVC